MVGDDWLYRVDSLISQGRVDEAQELLIDVVKNKPGNVQAWLLLADSIPVPEERVQVLEEALRVNPNNQEIQRVRARSADGESPPMELEGPPRAPEPPDLSGPPSSGAFAFSEEEWESFKTEASQPHPVADQDSFNPPNILSGKDDGEQWLETLRSMSWAGLPTEESPGASPKAETPAQDSAFNWQTEPAESTDEGPADLATLAWQSEDSSHSAEREGGVFGASSLFGNPSEGSGQPTPQTPALLSSASQYSRTSGGPDFGDPAEGEISGSTTTTPGNDELAGEIALQDLEEPAPRRTWLAFVLGAVILAVVAGAVILAWPSISGFFPVLAAAVPAETSAAGGAVLTKTNMPQPIPSITPTPTRTRTATPVPPSATPSPVPLVVNAVPVSVQNIQQFKLLAQSKGRYELSNDARVGIALSDALTVRVWDVVKDEIRLELKGPRAPIQSVAISPDGKLVAVASEEPVVFVWNANTGAVVSTLEFSKALVENFKDKTFSHTLQLRFGPEGKTLVAASLLGVTWWDLDSKQEHHIYPLTVAELTTFRSQAQTPKSGRATSFLMAFSPDGKSLAVGSPFKVQLLFWPSGNPWTSLATGKALIDLKFFSSNMLAMWHPGALTVWETISARQILTYPGLRSYQSQEVPPSAAFRPDGKMMAVESEDTRGQPGAFTLIDLPSGRSRITLDSNAGSPIENPIFSADGKLVMAGSGGDLFVWEVATGKELRRIANRKGFSKILDEGRIFGEYSTVGTILWGALP